MFFLTANNIRFEKNCEMLQDDGVVDSDKNIVSAYFSILDSNKMLVPHEGPWSGVLRMPWCGYTHGCVLSAGQGVSLEDRQGRYI